MQKTPTYLVIGANGFVGSHIVDKLAEQGVRVRAFDRFSRAPQFREHPNIEVIKGDFFDDNALRSAIVGVDYVLHSFSATTPFISDSNPYIDITDNLMRSVKIFDICASEGIKKIGFISSGGAVYGSLAEQKVATTEDDPALPVSPYGINKLAIECYLEYFKRKHGTDYVVYRLTNPYGPRQIAKNKQGVIPTFLERIKKNEEITIYGDGTTSRDYIFCEDAAAMITNSFMRDTKHSLYNIGSGKQTSLNEIIDALRELVPGDIKVTYADEPKTFLHRTGVNVERFVTEFGQPQLTSLHDGLTAVLAAVTEPHDQ